MIPNWLDIAMEELGQSEIAGPIANPRIAEYLATVGQAGDDEIAWCSAFVNWTFEQAGLIGTKKPNARSWLDWGNVVSAGQIGDVVVFQRGTSSWQGHVAFFLDRSPDGLIYVLGGNQGNSVSVARYLATGLMGVRRP